MIGSKVLYSGAAVYATSTALLAAAVTLRIPFQHNTIGPYNYHRVVKAGARIPWRRIRSL